VRGEAVPPFVPVPNRGMITLSIMMANIMQGVDNSILRARQEINAQCCGQVFGEMV
jgi:hypothetical protein